MSHPLRLVRAGARCGDALDSARRGWLVLRLQQPPSSLGGHDRATAQHLLLCLGGRRPDYSDSDYSVYRAAPLR